VLPDAAEAQADKPASTGKQQTTGSTHTSTGASSDDGLDTDECSVFSKLEELAEQGAKLDMLGASSSYTLGLQSLLGSGGEASAWQVLLEEVQLQTQQCKSAAASASVAAAQANTENPCSQHSSSSSSSVSTGLHCALKIASSQGNASHDMQVQHRNMQEEFQALVTARSNYVVRVFDVGWVMLPAPAAGNQRTPAAPGAAEACFEVRVPCMLMEFSTVGSLQDYVALINQKLAAEGVDSGGLTQQQAQHIARHVVRGLFYIHQCEILHRDLKAGEAVAKLAVAVQYACFCCG
jgi:serine/threonine protein kinase